jgi:hypothetical protein
VVELVAGQSEDRTARRTGVERLALACREVVEAAGQGVGEQVIVETAARGLRGLTGVDRCRVDARGRGDGLFRGQFVVVAAGERRPAPAVPGELTRRILDTRAPALHRTRAARDPGLMWQATGLLGMPLRVAGEVRYVLYADDAGVPHSFDQDDIDLAAAFGEVVSSTLDQAAELRNRRGKLVSVTRQLAMLRRGVAVDERFAALAPRDGDLHTVAALLTELTGRAAWVLDQAGGELASAGAGAGCPAAAAAAAAGLGWSDRPVVLPARPGADPAALVAAMAADDGRLGLVVLGATDRPFDGLDSLCVRRAAAVATAMRRHAIELERAARYSAEALLRDVVAGAQPPAALTERALAHGVDLDEPRLVVVAPALSDPAVLLACYARHCAEPGSVMCTSGSDGPTLLVAPRGAGPIAIRAARVRAAFAAVSAELDLPIGISALCWGAAEIACAAAEARRAAGQDDRGRLRQPLSGVGHLLGTLGPVESVRFARGVLGGLVDGSEDRTGELLRTLCAFVDAGRNARAAAEDLGVHENTVRYRLGRISELTGLNVIGDAEDQLTAHLAVLAIRAESVPA